MPILLGLMAITEGGGGGGVFVSKKFSQILFSE